VDGYEKIRDPIYGGLTLLINPGDTPRWHTQDVGMWNGHRAYIEIADGATVDYNGPRSGYVNGDGFIAVDEIRFSDRAEAPREAGKHAVVVPTHGEQVAESLARYKAIESRIPAPTLAPAVVDG